MSWDKIRKVANKIHSTLEDADVNDVIALLGSKKLAGAYIVLRVGASFLKDSSEDQEEDDEEQEE